MKEMLKETVIIDCISLIGVRFKLRKYPKLDSDKRLIKKGLILLETYTPKISDYIARQKVLGNIERFQLTVRSKRKRKPKRIRKYFKLWIKKERFKRVVFMILEGLVLPVTPFLAVIPGPNVFFYVPFMLFYFHFQSYKGLKKIDVKGVQISTL